MEAFTRTAVTAQGGATRQLLELARNVDPIRLKRQLWLGGLTCIFSLFGTVALTVFVRFGPALDAQVAAFVGLSLFACLGLFAVAALATLGPTLEALVSERLQRLRAENSMYELEQMRDVVVTFVLELKQSEDPSARAAVIERYQPELSRLVGAI